MQRVNTTVISTEKIKVNSITHRVASNFSWSVLSAVLGKGIFFFTNLYLARILGVENFGLLVLAQTVTFYFWGAVDLGTNMYGIREIAKNKEYAEEIINPLLTLRISIGFAVFLLYAISLQLLDIPPLKKLVFAGAALYLLTYAFYSDWIFKGLEKFRYLSLGSLVSSVSFLLAAVFFIKGSENVLIAALAWSVSYVLGSVVLIYFLLRKLGIRYRPNFDIKIWLYHLRESVYFQVSGTLMMITQYLPVLLLGLFFSDYVVGLFSAPYRIIVFVCHSGFLIMMSAYPVLSDLFKKDAAQLAKTQTKLLKLMLAAGLSLGIVGMVFSGKIVEIALGRQYSQSTEVFKILVWLIPVYFVRYVFGPSLQVSGLQRLHTLSTIFGLIGMLSTGILSVYIWGPIGGAFALLVSEILVVLAMTCYNQRIFISKSNKSSFSKS